MLGLQSCPRHITLQVLLQKHSQRCRGCCVHCSVALTWQNQVLAVSTSLASLLLEQHLPVHWGGALSRSWMRTMENPAHASEGDSHLFIYIFFFSAFLLFVKVLAHAVGKKLDRGFMYVLSLHYLLMKWDKAVGKKSDTALILMSTETRLFW